LQKLVGGPLDFMCQQGARRPMQVFNIFKRALGRGDEGLMSVGFYI
jgi:hypothetical protein